MSSIIKTIPVLLSILVISIAMPGCQKYLLAKQDQSLVVPKTIQDLQSLLDDYLRINDNDPSSGDLSSDDYYLNDNDYSGQNEYFRRLYTWEEKDLFKPGNTNDWTRIYNKVYVANVVLFNIDKIDRSDGDQQEWNNTKGTALFLRAKSFVQAAWIWSVAFDQHSAATDLGIPLRLDPDFNTPSKRASVQQTYEQVIQDFKDAIQLLPGTPLHVIRPSKPAARAWLARTYLSMRNYDSAFVYADQYLQVHDSLLDYNSLNPAGFPIIPSYNEEVIYHSSIVQDVLYNPITIADSTLYRSYSSDDLRKTVMFAPVGTDQYSWQGSYHGSNWIDVPFNGIATDEIYLIRAECYARKGNTKSAMDDLNTLLIKRWKTGRFSPLTAVNAMDAIAKILLERRKELYFRGLRWIDIKRFNKDGAAIVLKRFINGKEYMLPPNDVRYALPIPEDVIAISGMPQNPR